MPTELGGIKITISAEVADALSALQAMKRDVGDLASSASGEMKRMTGALGSVDTGLIKTAAVANRESEKVTGFMGKWKMGWIAMGAAAIASLYAVAKSSAVIGGYFREFGWIVGDIFDEIGIAMSPVIDPLLDFLWECADAFAALPEPIKAATGAIIFAAIGLSGLAVIANAVKTAFAGLGISGVLAGIGAKIAALAAPLAGLAVFIAGMVGIFELWKHGVTAAIGGVIDKFLAAHPVIETAVTAIAGPIMMLGKVVVDVFEHNIARIPEDLRSMFAMWKTSWTLLYTWTVSWVKGLWDKVIGIFESAYARVAAIIGEIKSVMSSVPGINIISEIRNVLPEYQHGGYVPTTGPAFLHAGEYVIPRAAPSPSAPAGLGDARVNITQNITITGGIKSELDIRRLTDEIARNFKNDLRRLVRNV